ncbi:MAG: DNA cytosine methyltransferase [Candidatus Njordarchaeia archaeon]
MIYKPACDTYATNFQIKLVRKDAFTVDSQRFAKKPSENIGDIDVMVGCPPCQGFFTNNQKRNHPRNELEYNTHFVKVIKPKVHPKVLLVQ